MLLAVAMVMALAACGDSAPAAPQAPAANVPAADSASGSVYYLNFKPEADAAWQELAKTYTEKAVVEDIHANAAALGFDAFTASGLDGSSSWRFSGHLANMPLFYEFRDDNATKQPATITGAYLQNYKRYRVFPYLSSF